MEKTGNRFVIYKEKISLEKSVTILLDSQTGVHYLAYQDGYAGGLTPLLDQDGKVVVVPVEHGR